MVTRLTRFRSDPNKLGRGEGYYYLRGGKRAGSFTLKSGVSVQGPYYSKYSQKRDTAKLSKGWKTHKVGVPKKVATKYAHVTDGFLNQRINR